MVTVTLQIKKGAIGAFREAVPQQANNSLTKERGGRRFDVRFHTACPERMFLYATYDDRKTFERHRETEHFADFDRTTAPLIASKAVATWKLHRLT